ncbi:MAG: adenine phosphoribosyltransferase [Lachnospiraceae bacterium]|nr:adenine phosphoribosyltransferase [Lachnospiraceae bacterium]
MKKIEEYVRAIPDFPEKGIIFRDITTVIGDADGFKLAIEEYSKILENMEFDVIAGLESRGFIFGAPLAYKFNKPFVLVRKKGKLPGKTIGKKYELEYGTAEIEMHVDSIKPGQKVVIIDDLIATGGTIGASIQLIEELGGEVVGCVFLIELEGLNGRDKLKGYRVESIIRYEGA